MTDGNATWQTAPGEQPDRPRRATLVAGAAVAVVVLASVGAIGGWLLAGGGGTDPAIKAGPGPSTAATSAGPAPTNTPTNTRSTSAPSTGRTTTTPAPPAGQFALPDFVGQDFEQARAELRERGLGWTLMFADAGDDRSVARTEPSAGTYVGRGTAVKLFVAGAAPLTAVPAVTGFSCDQARGRLVEAGFTPDYRTGKSGPVLRQDPGPGAQLQWNGKVQIFCGDLPPVKTEQPSPEAT